MVHYLTLENSNLDTNCFYDSFDVDINLNQISFIIEKFADVRFIFEYFVDQIIHLVNQIRAKN